MVIAWLFVMLSTAIGQTQDPPPRPSDAAASIRDCRAEYQRLMKVLDQATVRLDAADRAHDVRAMRAAVIDARRVVANVKARAAACGSSEQAEPSPAPSAPKNESRKP